MHELSIAQNIIEMIQQHVPETAWNHVAAVRVKIGAMAGIVPDSLDFSFQAITADTAFSRTHLITERIPFCVQCRVCAMKSENEEGFALCGACGSTDIQIISGTELLVSDIEIEEGEE